MLITAENEPAKRVHVKSLLGLILIHFVKAWIISSSLNYKLNNRKKLVGKPLLKKYVSEFNQQINIFFLRDNVDILT